MSSSAKCRIWTQGLWNRISKVQSHRAGYAGILRAWIFQNAEKVLRTSRYFASFACTFRVGCEAHACLLRVPRVAYVQNPRMGTYYTYKSGLFLLLLSGNQFIDLWKQNELHILENLYGFVEIYLPILEIISRHGEYWINVFWHPWLPLLVSCGLYGLLAGVLRWHLRANTRSSLGPSFEHAQSCLRAICTCVHTCGWDPCEVRAKCWNFRRQKLYPVTCSQGFSGLTQPCLLWGTISIICGISL